jgi:signal transduction histidine kinase
MVGTAVNHVAVAARMSSQNECAENRPCSGSNTHPLASLARGRRLPDRAGESRGSLVRSTQRRLPDPVEVAAYYVVAEGLTNAAKYARASAVEVCIDMEEQELNLSIRDDGIGGADVSKGSGLTGLGDRVEALGGMLSISSHPGVGTELHATIPFRSSFTDPLR